MRPASPGAWPRRSQVSCPRSGTPRQIPPRPPAPPPLPRRYGSPRPSHCRYAGSPERPAAALADGRPKPGRRAGRLHPRGGRPRPYPPSSAVSGACRKGSRTTDGEDAGGGKPQRWGPPREHIDRATALLAVVAFLIALGAQILTFGLSLTPDRYLLVLLAPALVIGRGRRFMLDFVPFVLLIVWYEECRGLAHIVHPIPVLHAAPGRREVPVLRPCPLRWCCRTGCGPAT